MNSVHRAFALAVVTLATGAAFAQPAVIGPSTEMVVGSLRADFTGPSINYPYYTVVPSLYIGAIFPGAGGWASRPLQYAFNGAECYARLTIEYTYTTTPTVTTISGWVMLSSSIVNATNTLTIVDCRGSLTIPIDLQQNATMTSTFWTPGDPALATGTYQGTGIANNNPLGPAAAVPAFSTSGFYTPGQYTLGGNITSHMQAGAGFWDTQNVRLNFSVVIEAVPAPSGAAALGLSGLLAMRRRRR